MFIIVRNKYTYKNLPLPFKNTTSIEQFPEYLFVLMSFILGFENRQNWYRVTAAETHTLQLWHLHKFFAGPKFWPIQTLPGIEFPLNSFTHQTTTNIASITRGFLHYLKGQ
jgi:hypothetical protein